MLVNIKFEDVKNFRWFTVVRKKLGYNYYDGFSINDTQIVVCVERYYISMFLKEKSRSGMGCIDKIAVYLDSKWKVYNVRYKEKIDGEAYEMNTLNSECFVFDIVKDNVILFEEDLIT